MSTSISTSLISKQQKEEVSRRSVLASSLERPWLLALSMIFVLALALRLYNLDAYNLWYDEIQSIEAARRGADAIFTRCAGWICNQTAGHYLLTSLTLQFADPLLTTFWVRLPSVLAGALTPLVVYGLGRELFGRPQG